MGKYYCANWVSRRVRNCRKPDPSWLKQSSGSRETAQPKLKYGQEGAKNRAHERNYPGKFTERGKSTHCTSGNPSRFHYNMACIADLRACPNHWCAVRLCC